jgi:predicted unusual protein kinase regulating ubiquinone biosynthesis (AarF/ABC1/UbiB family)
MSRGRLVLRALSIPFRRRRPSGGPTGDAAVRRDELLAMGGGLARTVAKNKLRGLFRTRAGRAAAREQAMQQVTVQAVQQLGAMKGLPMKVGQMASYLHVLPDEAQRELATLQADSAGIPPEAVRELLATLFGDTAPFAAFDEVPVAAASIGQVHRATLRDGREVAVKLRYPGVEAALAADIDNMETLTAVARVGNKADTSTAFDVIAQSMLAELDYERERSNQGRIASFFTDHPHVLVPRPVDELSSAECLVTEFVAGSRLAASADWSQARRDRTAEVMYRFALGCVMNGLFSGDPHPGNYLFPDDGRVAFLDFGMVLELGDDASGRAVRSLLAAGLSGDVDGIEAGLRQLGLVIEGDSPVQAWEELRDVLLGPVVHDGPVRLDGAWCREAMGRLSSKDGAINHVLRSPGVLDPACAVWLRYGMGALAVIAQLEPELDWGAVAREVVLGREPSTPVGLTWGTSPGGAEFARSAQASFR